jgi:23S rRNA (cytidine1920-2'-O)/16S rRNA (cytidine1409-2'-O)-methyltransferase
LAKKRIDVTLVEQGLAPSREKAQALIISGNVLVNDVPVTKPGHSIEEDARIRIRGEDHPYVSRGGIKLARAIEAFHVPVAGRVGLDVGASTGGFTHVLLLGGISKVFAVDVGHNQMDWKIRQDPRVVVHEKINARNMEYELIGQKVDLIVIDVSFISLDKILPTLVQFADPRTDWITLIKPQFEVGKEKVGKGGIVSSEEHRQEAIERLTRFAETLGLKRIGLIESPITGTQGNKEFLAHWHVEKAESSN